MVKRGNNDGKPPRHGTGGAGNSNANKKRKYYGLGANKKHGGEGAGRSSEAGSSMSFAEVQLGDYGVLVTCDKGFEINCAREATSLIQWALEKNPALVNKTTEMRIAMGIGIESQQPDQAHQEAGVRITQSGSSQSGGSDDERQQQQQQQRDDHDDYDKVKGKGKEKESMDLAMSLEKELAQLRQQAHHQPHTNAPIGDPDKNSKHKNKQHMATHPLFSCVIKKNAGFVFFRFRKLKNTVEPIASQQQGLKQQVQQHQENENVNENEKVNENENENGNEQTHEQKQKQEQDNHHQQKGSAFSVSGPLSSADASPFENMQVHPLHLVQEILQTAKELRATRSRSCSRIIPVYVVTYPQHDTAAKALEPFVRCVMGVSEADKATFGIQYKSKTNPSTSRELFIKEIADVVPKVHKVDLSNPVYTIYAEIIRNRCFLAILPTYAELAKYNIRMIVEKAIEADEQKSDLNNNKQTMPSSDNKPTEDMSCG